MSKSAAKKPAKSAKKSAAKKAPAKKSVKKTPAPSRRPKASGTYAELAANRNTQSTIEHPVHAMWDLCDKMVNSSRKEVIAAAVAKGISYYTARTQYQLWLTAYRNSK